MNDLASLVQAAATLVLVVAPIIALARLLGGADDVGVTLSDVFAVSVNPPWPHRMQEEEPARWQVERLRPRQRAVSPSTAHRAERGAGRGSGHLAGRPAPAAVGSEPGCGG